MDVAFVAEQKGVNLCINILEMKDLPDSTELEV